MTEGSRLSNWLDVGWLTFWIHAGVWSLAPLLFAILRVEIAAAILMGGLGVSVIMHLLAHRPLWVALHPVALVLQITYLGAAAWVWNAQNTFEWPPWLVLCALIFLLGSDVVAVRQRAVILSIIMLALLFETRLLLSHYPQKQFIELIWPAGGIATVSRAFWPTSSHGLLQTSLDYGRCRIDIVSYGMKKALAIGLRLNL